jgi:hypothetical protein
MRGYNAHPDVISEQEMDDYVDAGEIELWRGMQQKGSVDVAEDYRSGRHYPGGTNGTQYGTGTYAAYGYHAGGQRDAIKFASGSHAYGGGPNGVLVRMTIKADARVVEYDELVSKLRNDNSPEATAIRGASYGYGDVGLYAVLLGYDVIRKSHGYQGSHSAANADNWDDGFVVIVNRSAVRISEKNYVPDSNPRAKAGANPPPKRISQATHRMRSKQAKHEAGVDYGRKIKREP